MRCRPGRRLAQRLADHYLKRPPMESVGGTLIMEVFGKQVDQAIGTLLRRIARARRRQADVARDARDPRGGSRGRIASCSRG